MPHIVAVFGATGTQGSSVVDALHADRTFTPRAVTRDASSEAARKLAAHGVEVVTADLWDKESIKRALTGCECVFGVTNYYDQSIAGANHTGEIDQGKTLIDSAKEVGIKFLVWSSLPHSTNLSNGKYPGVHHFDSKFIVEEYLKRSGLPCAAVQTGWFAENLWLFDLLTQAADGSYSLTVPRYSPAATNADRKDEILNETFYVANAHITYPDFAKVLSKVLGKPVQFTAPPYRNARAGCHGQSHVVKLQEYDFQSDISIYRHSALSDPRLVTFSVKFGTLEEFAEQRVKPRFS